MRSATFGLLALSILISGQVYAETSDTHNSLEEEEEDRVVHIISKESVNTRMGSAHPMTIPSDSFTNSESCHIKTPTGAKYEIMEGFHIPGVDLIEEHGVECGVTINLITEDLVGEWVLIGKANRFSEPIERRSSLTINVEEQVNAVPNRVHMAAGTDLYVRLENPTDLYETCELIPPNETADYEVDGMHANSCGYIVRGVTVEQSGQWIIKYGTSITYKAIIDVNIFAPSAIEADHQTWTLGTSVQKTIGPEDAVYCKLENSKGLVMYEGFDRCNVNINSVTEEHQGTWTMSVGMPGVVAVERTEFTVFVQEAVTPVVTTSVVRVAPSVIITCSVPSGYEVQGCKFRDHHGNIMIAHNGVGQGIGPAGTTGYQSEVTSNSCTLRLTNPTPAELGLWRCAVDTADETLYAFITVTCPWLTQIMDDPVNLEPVLTQDSTNIYAVEQEPTVMSCSIEASLRYCYFRARNGSIFNVRPGHSTEHYEYVGAGLQAGDCGIRFNNLLVTDSGRWSCHVGLLETATEESKQFEVLVQEKMVISHYRHSDGGLVLEGAVHNYHRLEYCRYIRIDGLGFSSDNVPEGYSVDKSVMENGFCTLFMHVTILNMHPWTIVAKLAGVEQEITKYSLDHIMTVNGPEEPPSNSNNNFGFIFLWVACAMCFLALLGMCVALGPKKNREWTYARANQLRNSIRKTPLPTEQPRSPTEQNV